MITTFILSNGLRVTLVTSIESMGWVKSQIVAVDLYWHIITIRAPVGANNSIIHSNQHFFHLTSVMRTFDYISVPFWLGCRFGTRMGWQKGNFYSKKAPAAFVSAALSMLEPNSNFITITCCFFRVYEDKARLIWVTELGNFVKLKWNKTKIVCLKVLIKWTCFVKYSVRVLILYLQLPPLKTSSRFEKYRFAWKRLLAPDRCSVPHHARRYPYPIHPLIAPRCYICLRRVIFF